MDSRPKFLGSFFRAVGDAIDRRGLRAIFPIWLVLGLVIGAAVAWYMPSIFWADERWGVATTVYTGLLAFDGLLLALGWGAFSKIYEILSTGWFAAFLRRNNLLSDHLLYVQIVHATLVVSALSSGCGLLTIFFSLPIWADKIILAGAVGLSLYALIKALSAMSMMNDLIWELAHSDRDEKGHVRPVPSAKQNDS